MSAPQPPKVELRNLSKRFGSGSGATVVLADISLAIARGELVVLLGRSGCGKSTLLRLVAGLEEASSGDIIIDGSRANDLPPKDRDLAMVFQSYALYPHMTVAENIAFPLVVRGVARAEREAKVREVAEVLGLADLAGRRPEALSGGQRQRVAIGRALVRSPSLFLFDEPLSNLDAALRTRMRLELKALHRRLDATMIYVTHDQTEAMTLATRIAILERGVLQQVGTPEEIYRRPQNTFVATFIGSPPMNLVRGTLTDGTFRADGLTVPVEGTPARDGVLLGIRPEHLVIAREGGPGRAEAEVLLVEPVGDRGHIHLKAGDLALTASVEGARAFEMRPGERVFVAPRSDEIHFFDAETGKRLP